MDLMHSRCRMKSFCRGEWWFNILESANKRSSKKSHDFALNFHIVLCWYSTKNGLISDLKPSYIGIFIAIPRNYFLRLASDKNCNIDRNSDKFIMKLKFCTARHFWKNVSKAGLTFENVQFLLS